MRPIFEYRDYRAYLRDYYSHKKANNRMFSYRLFARLAEYKSPSFFIEIARGQKRLSLWMAERFGKAMNLNDEEMAWLKRLVQDERSGQFN